MWFLKFTRLLLIQRVRIIPILSNRCYSSDQLVGPGYMSFGHKGEEPDSEIHVLPRARYGGISTVTLLTGSTLIGQAGAKFISSLLYNAQVPIDLQRISTGDNVGYYNSVLCTRCAIHVEIVHDLEVKKKALRLCNDLNLYVFMTRLRTFPGFNCRFPDVDFQLIAQNNMGNYAELEYQPVDDVVEALRVVSTKSIEKFFTFAFDAVQRMGRKRIAIVHNNLEWPITDGAFVDIAMEMQKCNYPKLEIEPIMLNSFLKRIILEPQYFDVVFVSDRLATAIATVCCGVCGGANLFSSIEMGDNHAIFKPMQTKLSLTNYKTLSPYGIISACTDLLHHIRLHKCADKLWQQMLRSMEDGVKTKDFGGSDIAEYVISNIMNRLRCNPADENR